MTLRVLTCDETVRALWDYVDHAVEGPLREEVAAHLAGCTACAGHVAFAHRLLQEIRQVPVADAEVSALEARVKAALAHEVRA